MSDKRRSRVQNGRTDDVGISDMANREDCRRRGVLQSLRKPKDRLAVIDSTILDVLAPVELPLVIELPANDMTLSRGRGDVGTLHSSGISVTARLPPYKNAHHVGSINS